MSKSDPNKNLDRRWGSRGVIDLGWSAVPHLLVRNLKKLKMTAPELALLLNILSHDNGNGELPWTPVATLAEHMGKSERAVQKLVATCVAKGFMLKVERFWNDGRPRANAFDLTPLFDKLEVIMRAQLEARPRPLKGEALDHLHAVRRALKTFITESIADDASLEAEVLRLVPEARLVSMWRQHEPLARCSDEMKPMMVAQYVAAALMVEGLGLEAARVALKRSDDEHLLEKIGAVSTKAAA